MSVPHGSLSAASKFTMNCTKEKFTSDAANVNNTWQKKWRRNNRSCWFATTLGSFTNDPANCSCSYPNQKWRARVILGGTTLRSATSSASGIRSPRKTPIRGFPQTRSPANRIRSSRESTNSHARVTKVSALGQYRSDTSCIKPVRLHRWHMQVMTKRHPVQTGLLKSRQSAIYPTHAEG